MEALKTIDTNALAEWLARPDRPVLVNALPRERFERTRIPGSISIPAGSARDLAPRLLAPEQPVVVYCASLTCQDSPRLARELMELGFTNVIDYEGGIRQWYEAGFPVEPEAPSPVSSSPSTARS